MPASTRCRENFRRSITVSGEINDALLQALTPRILELRQQGAQPITLYIDSRGGDPRTADALIGLLSAPDAEGAFREVVTVVTRTAASAAANLLVSGHYVIAYPNTQLFFHGLRYADLPATTFERATFAAKLLRESNESRALSLAAKVIDRLLFLFMCCQPRIAELRQPPPPERETPLSDIELFVQVISRYLSPPTEKVCRKALANYLALERMTYYAYVNASWPVPSSPGVIHCELLKALIQHKLEQRRGDPQWLVSDDEMASLFDDHKLIIDYSVGRTHQEAVDAVARRMGRFLLSEAELADYEQLAGESAEAREAWLLGRIKPKIQPLWYFTVCVCRLLQLDENPLTALDAYWLGLVNEVLGAPLPNIRQVIENPAEGMTVEQPLAESDDPPAAADGPPAAP